MVPGEQIDLFFESFPCPDLYALFTRINAENRSSVDPPALIRCVQFILLSSSDFIQEEDTPSEIRSAMINMALHVASLESVHFLNGILRATTQRSLNYPKPNTSKQDTINKFIKEARPFIDDQLLKAFLSEGDWALFEEMQKRTEDIKSGSHRRATEPVRIEPPLFGMNPPEPFYGEGGFDPRDY